MRSGQKLGGPPQPLGHRVEAEQPGALLGAGLAGGGRGDDAAGGHQRAQRAGRVRAAQEAPQAATVDEQALHLDPVEVREHLEDRPGIVGNAAIAEASKRKILQNTQSFVIPEGGCPTTCRCNARRAEPPTSRPQHKARPFSRHWRGRCAVILTTGCGNATDMQPLCVFVLKRSAALATRRIAPSPPRGA